MIQAIPKSRIAAHTGCEFLEWDIETFDGNSSLYEPLNEGIRVVTRGAYVATLNVQLSAERLFVIAYRFTVNGIHPGLWKKSGKGKTNYADAIKANAGAVIGMKLYIISRPTMIDLVSASLNIQKVGL